MATVPSNAQFRADTTGVTVEQLGSELTNARAAFFTMADIAQSAGPTTNNTVYGLNAFDNNVSGEENTAVGNFTLYSNTTGSFNTALGTGALGGNGSGSSNIAVGSFAMEGNETGQNNIAIGAWAMGAAYSGSSNIAIGFNAAYELYGGDFNIVIGNEEYSLEDGIGNVAIGHQLDTRNCSHSVILGRQAEASGDNQFVVGSSSYNAGAVATETNTSSKVWNVVINGVAQKILLA